jgi:anaerobic selenocysteine-containing dehydrogenase
MYGKEATAENDFCYDWLLKLDVVYGILRTFELKHQGKINGYFCQGFNPLMAFPNKKEGDQRSQQAEIPGGHGSSGHGDGELLGEPWRL